MIKIAVLYKFKGLVFLLLYAKMVIARHTFRAEIVSEGTSQKHTMRVCINHICLLQDNEEHVELLGGEVSQKKPCNLAAGSSKGWRTQLMHLGKLPPNPFQDLCITDD